MFLRNKHLEVKVADMGISKVMPLVASHRSCVWFLLVLLEPWTASA